MKKNLVIYIDKGKGWSNMFIFSFLIFLTVLGILSETHKFFVIFEFLFLFICLNVLFNIVDNDFKKRIISKDVDLNEMKEEVKKEVFK